MPKFEKLQDTALIAVRLIVAAIFLYAGYAKFGMWTAPPEGMPSGMLILTKFLSVVEPLGAVAILVGFLTRWAAAGLAVIMVGAFFFLKFAMQSGFFTGQQGTGLDYIVLIFAGCLVLCAFGAGNVSVDAKRR